MRWYHATRILIENQTQETIHRAVVFQTRFWGVLSVSFFPPSWSLPNLLCITKVCLKKHWLSIPVFWWLLLHSCNISKALTLMNALIKHSTLFIPCSQSHFDFHPILILISLFSYLMLKLPAQSTFRSFPKLLVFYLALVCCQKWY